MKFYSELIMRLLLRMLKTTRQKSEVTVAQELLQSKYTKIYTVYVELYPENGSQTVNK